MNTTSKQISSRLRLLGASLLALAGVFTSPLSAQTIWDGGAGDDKSINNATNWDNDVVSPLNGSTAGTFASDGSNATLNVSGKFKTLTFNRASGFTINGPGTLTVSNSTGSGSPNVIVSVSQSAGQTVINAPFAVETGTTATKLLNIQNNSGLGLVFSNTVSATVPANSYGFRLQGSGTTRFVGAITNCNGIQPALAAYTGTNIFGGNQVLGSSTAVNIPGSSTANSSATARLQMGETTGDVQSWGSTIISQVGTIAINSSATLSGGISLETATSAYSSGGILEVNGVLSATTLGIGSTVAYGAMKVGGTASFSGTITVGSGGGNQILGNATNAGTLVLSSGNINSGVIIGGSGENENNLILVKTNSGTLTLGGAHSYTNRTLVKAGRLDLTGTLASPVTVFSGASLGGEGSTTDTITFGAGTENLYFDPTTGAALTANTINATGATIIVNPSSSASGVVMQSTTTPNGITGAVGVNFVSGARGNLTLNGAADTLSFTPTSAADLKWKGNAANPTYWDVITTTNWTKNDIVDRFYSSDTVTFDDTASSFVVAIQPGSVTPGSTTISNNLNAYTFTNGAIGGTGSLVKNGTNKVTFASGSHSFSGGLTINAGTMSFLGGANTFIGGITNNGGTLVISSLNQIYAGASSFNSINLNSGAFSYTGPTATSETLTFNLLGGISTIDVNDTATGTNIYTLRTGAPVTGSGDLIKTGNGDLTFGKNVAAALGNTFTGKITVKGGIMDIRNADSLGDVAGMTEVTNASLMMYPFGQTLSFSFDPEPVSFSGNSEFRYQPPTGTVNTYVTWTGPFTNSGNLNITSFPNTNGATLVIQSDVVNNGTTTLNLGYNTNGALANLNNITINGSISGAATVTAFGTNGSLYTLSGANTYTGNTTINNGTLSLGGSGSVANSPVITVNSNGTLDVSGVSFTLGVGQTLQGSGRINGNVTANGTIIPGASVGMLRFSNDLTINGNLVVELNKSLAQPNDVINVLGTLNNAGTGTLTVSNIGPGLVAGDKFTLFSQLLPNGQNLTILPPVGVTFTNNLADDGSITVLTAPALMAGYPTNITASVSGSTLTLTWPATHLGWFLQAQTNTLGVGLTTPTNTWHDITGSDAATSKNIPVNPGNPSVFFRLRHP